MTSRVSPRSYALRLLKFRPRSEEELRLRLGRKGVEPLAQEAVIAELRRKGLVDDAKFAQYYATGAVLSKPQGRRALLHGLKARGIDPQIAGAAVDLATKDQDELQTARSLALQRLSRLKGLDAQTVRRRLFGLLSRRGFSSDVVYRIVREVTAEGSHPRPSSRRRGSGSPLSRGWAGSSEDRTPSSIRSRIPPFGGMTE